MLKIIAQATCCTLAVGLLVGCATQELREERALCTSQWMQTIPPVFEKELYNKTMSREVPTGQVNCTTTGTYIRSTSCTQVMRTEYYTVPAVRTIDRNEDVRDAQIKSCVQSQCIQKFGNSDCKK